MAASWVTKKLINSTETCVDDNLRGVVAMYPKLHLHPKHRVITVRNEKVSNKVAVLGGGGSGHEPFAAGLVGSGMLDGAVAGGVFASPPTGHVLYAIAELCRYNKGGVIVIIGNYTGDRLNFGKAIEKAKIAGLKVEGLIVGEDVASSHNKTGGRSMCGEVFFYKLCGGMAAARYDLETIHSIAAEATKHMATLGVCLRPCSLPGQPPLFEIADDEMELGAGVHGEAGIAKLKLGTAAEVVQLLVDKILEHMKLKAGDRVAVMIANLGGTSCMEMNILTGETKIYLEKHHIKVERIYTGHLKTSLEMHGFQICLLHLNMDHGDLWLKLLDHPTDAAWVGSQLCIGDGGNNIGDDETLLQSDVRQISSGPSLNQSQQQLLRRCLEKAAEDLVSSEGLLNQLDSGCGDGDCGITMKKFALALQSYLLNPALAHPSAVLWDLSEIAETDLGGTSGGIYSLGLSAAAKVLSRSEKLDVATWLQSLQGAMAAITKYGGAEPGDRTMLDTLASVATSLKQNLQKDLKTCLKKALEAADEGAKSTVKMTARAGRASYVSSEYMKSEDAGARAVAVWLGAALRQIYNH